MGRVAIAALTALWLTPVLATGLIGVGLDARAAIPAAFVVAASAAHLLSRKLRAIVAPAIDGRGWTAALGVALALVAVAQIARLSVFMADASQRRYSADPSDAFRSEHSCMTAYCEAARFAGEGRNIYDASLYQPRRAGPLRIDSFHYPPPFLLMPAAVRSITSDIFGFRAVWFCLQALVLAGTLFGIAGWIGGPAGARVVLGNLLFFCMPPVMYVLQQGNFQITAVPLAMIAVALFGSGRVASGAGLLAYVAAAKIFPGILVVSLAAAREWRALAWTAGFGAALLALTVLVAGTRPVSDFVRHELPQISDGRAFPHTELPTHAHVNQSVYGLVTRARALGATSLDQRTGLRIASVYGLLVIALAAFIGWRMRVDTSHPDGRLRLALTGLALLALASFRSPFVGGAYAIVSTLWLLALLGGQERRGRLALCLAAIVILSAVTWLTPSPLGPPSVLVLVVSALSFLFLLAVNGVTAARALRIEAPPAAAASAAVQ